MLLGNVKDFFIVFAMRAPMHPSTTVQENSLRDDANVPLHVAIIMDGNRRWAERNHLPIASGHKKGVETLMEVIRAASEVGVKTLTVYAFSTENWGRPAAEITILMHLFKFYLALQQEVLKRNGVRIQSIGDLTPFPDSVKKALENAKEATKDCNKICLVLALNYGGRDELCRAFVKIAKEIEEGRLCKEECTEELISKYLDTAPYGDPELVIRSGGEMRLSNFLLWQVSYSEVFLTDVLWPDFSREDFLEAVVSYQKRQRRLGS